MPAASVLLPTQCQLGEGALWDALGQRLYFVDIQANTVFELDPVTGSRRQWKTPTNVGTVVTRSAAKGGGLVVALKDRFAHLDTATGTLTNLAALPGELPAHVRLNDGKCDPAGRFWAGTLDFKDHRAELYRLDADGSLHRMLGDVTCSNGIVWSRDRRTMWYVDTPTHRVDAFDYDDATGAISNRRPAVAVDEGMGSPDGMTIDAEDNLYVALWGGSAVAVFDPRSGKLLEKIEVPGAKNVTSVALGGRDLQQMFITTASAGTKAEEKPTFPHAGDLFAMDNPLKIPGVPAAAYAG